MSEIAQWCSKTEKAKLSVNKNPNKIILNPSSSFGSDSLWSGKLTWAWSYLHDNDDTGRYILIETSLLNHAMRTRWPLVESYTLSVRLFQLNCTQPSWLHIKKVVFGADMSPMFRVCARSYVLDPVGFKCVKTLAIVVHIAKDHLWVSPIIFLQVLTFKLLLKTLTQTEVTADDNSSLGIVVSVVGAVDSRRRKEGGRRGKEKNGPINPNSYQVLWSLNAIPPNSNTLWYIMVTQCRL